jgi:F-type H+-transporting ATPase subunit gamma
MATTSMREIKARTKSIKNIRQITRAMMLVAAAKLGKAESAVKRIRPYIKRLSEFSADVAVRAEPGRHPLLFERPKERELLLVITSDRGLCGGFNTNLLKEATAYIEGEPELVIIGKKGFEYFRRRGYRIAERHPMPDRIEPSFSEKIAYQIFDGYIKERFDRVVIIFSKFISAFKQQPTVKVLLPLPKAEPKNLHDYIYEQPPYSILDQIFREYLKFHILWALIESQAAEHAARMCAMEQATNNAKKMLDELFHSFNQARQASITSEIAEVVTAVEAM